MTNFEVIKSFNVDGLVDFIYQAPCEHCQFAIEGICDALGDPTMRCEDGIKLWMGRKAE